MKTTRPADRLAVIIRRPSPVAGLFLMAALASGSLACRRPPPAKDPHLDKGYSLLLEDPAQALAELTQAKPTKDGSKEYGVGLAHEALGQLDLAKKSFEAALAAREGLVSAETARARISLLQGDVKDAHQRLAQTITKAPDELPALLLFALTAKEPAEKERALAALLAYPDKRAAKVKDAPLPAEYLLTLGALQQQTGKAEPARESLKRGLQAPLARAAGAIAVAKLAAALQSSFLAGTLMQRLADSKLAGSEARELALLALRTGRLGIAQAAAKKIPVFPEEAANFLVLGQVQMLSGQETGAMESLSRGLALLPPKATLQRSEAEFMLAQALIDQKQAPRALPLLKALETREPERASVQVMLARVELAQKQAAAAVRRLTKLQSKQQQLPDIYQHLGAAQLAAGQTAAAERSFREWVRLLPKSQEALLRLIEVLGEQGKHKEVLAELRAAVDRNPSDAGFLRLLVTRLLEAKQAGEAIAILEARAKEAPATQEGLWLLLASTYEKLGRKAELRSTLEAITQRTPGSMSGWLSLARLEESAKNPKGAESALVRALEIDPHSVEARRHLAEIFVRKSAWKEAAAHFEKLLADAPSDVGALNNLAFTYSEYLALPDKAVETAEKALALSPGQPAVEDTLGWALLRRGKAADLPRALELLERASARLDQDDCRLHFAVALHLSGKAKQAEKLLSHFRFRKADAGHQFALKALGRE